jgi:hypothetical protein
MKVHGCTPATAWPHAEDDATYFDTAVSYKRILTMENNISASANKARLLVRQFFTGWSNVC